MHHRTLMMALADRFRQRRPNVKTFLLVGRSLIVKLNERTVCYVCWSDDEIIQIESQRFNMADPNSFDQLIKAFDGIMDDYERSLFGDGDGYSYYDGPKCEHAESPNFSPPDSRH